MGAVHKMPPPAPGTQYLIFFISDLHSFSMCEKTFNIFVQHAKLSKRPDQKLVVVIGGDYLDAEFLMKKKNENYAKNLKNLSGIDDYFIPLAEEELKWGNETLDRIQAVADITVFMAGNHDERYKYFALTDCPHEYRHNLISINS